MKNLVVPVILFLLLNSCNKEELENHVLKEDYRIKKMTYLIDENSYEVAVKIGKDTVFPIEDETYNKVREVMNHSNSGIMLINDSTLRVFRDYKSYDEFATVNSINEKSKTSENNLKSAGIPEFPKSSLTLYLNTEFRDPVGDENLLDGANPINPSYSSAPRVVTHYGNSWGYAGLYYWNANDGVSSIKINFEVADKVGSRLSSVAFFQDYNFSGNFFIINYDESYGGEFAYTDYSYASWSKKEFFMRDLSKIKKYWYSTNWNNRISSVSWK